MSTLHAEKLISEHPWITDVVGKKSFFDAKVKRLDGQTALFYYGRSGEDSTDNRWYLVNKEGKLLNEVGVKRPANFLERTFPFLCSWFFNSESIYHGILRTIKEEPNEEIVYVLQDYSGSLILYKLPKDQTAAMFVAAIEEATTTEVKKEN